MSIKYRNETYYLHNQSLCKIDKNTGEHVEIEIEDEGPNKNKCDPVSEITHFSDYNALENMLKSTVVKHPGNLTMEMLLSTNRCNILSCHCKPKSPKSKIVSSSRTGFRPCAKKCSSRSRVSQESNDPKTVVANNHNKSSSLIKQECCHSISDPCCISSETTKAPSQLGDDTRMSLEKSHSDCFAALSGQETKTACHNKSLGATEAVIDYPTSETGCCGRLPTTEQSDNGSKVIEKDCCSQRDPDQSVDNSSQTGCCSSKFSDKKNNACLCSLTRVLKHNHDTKCGHPLVRHDGHLDYIVEGRLHHQHDGHCDDHGPICINEQQPNNAPTDADNDALPSTIIESMV